MRGYLNKGIGGKGKGIMGHNNDRVSTPSDDELLAHRMERKWKLMRLQEERIENIMKNIVLKREEYGD